MAEGAATVAMRYAPSWASDDDDERAALHAALTAARTDDLRRGVSTVGPHRDELELHIGTLPARTHASQGEQRSLALALRLAVHDVVTESTGAAPILLLDDVFSELDPHRSAALVASCLRVRRSSPRPARCRQGRRPPRPCGLKTEGLSTRDLEAAAGGRRIPRPGTDRIGA